MKHFVDIKTTDGYYLRVFCIGFTKKQKTQRDRSTCYATGGQIRAIRKTMFDIISEECEKCDLKDLVAKFMTESMSFEIEKRCESIFPLQNVHIRKCKVLKKPKFDLVKLMEFHDSTGEDTGAKIDKVDAETRVSKLTGAGGRL